MMQGVQVNGIRPKTKTALKDALVNCPEAVDITATSDYDYDGPATEMPEGKVIYVVGPNPFVDRKWYANIERRGATFKVG